MYIGMTNWEEPLKTRYKIPFVVSLKESILDENGHADIPFNDGGIESITLNFPVFSKKASDTYFLPPMSPYNTTWYASTNKGILCLSRAKLGNEYNLIFWVDKWHRLFMEVLKYNGNDEDLERAFGCNYKACVSMYSDSFILENINFLSWLSSRKS